MYLNNTSTCSNNIKPDMKPTNHSRCLMKIYPRNDIEHNSKSSNNFSSFFSYSNLQVTDLRQKQ